MQDKKLSKFYRLKLTPIIKKNNNNFMYETAFVELRFSMQIDDIQTWYLWKIEKTTDGNVLSYDVNCDVNCEAYVNNMNL